MVGLVTDGAALRAGAMSVVRACKGAVVALKRAWNREAPDWGLVYSDRLPAC